MGSIWTRAISGSARNTGSRGRVSSPWVAFHLMPTSSFDAVGTHSGLRLCKPGWEDGSSGLKWSSNILPGSSGFFRALRGFPRFFRVLQGFFGLFTVFPGSSGFNGLSMFFSTGGVPGGTWERVDPTQGVPGSARALPQGVPGSAWTIPRGYLGARGPYPKGYLGALGPYPGGI